MTRKDEIPGREQCPSKLQNRQKYLNLDIYIYRIK